MLLQQSAQQRKDVASEAFISGPSNIIPMHLHHEPTPLLPCSELPNLSGSQASHYDSSILNFNVPMLHISLHMPIDLSQGHLDYDNPHITWEYQEDQWPPDGYQDTLDYHEDNQDLDAPDYNNKDTGVCLQAPPLEPFKDDPDPFVVEHKQRHNSPNSQDIPRYLLVIYATVSWLHLQFYLPHVVCNVMLAILVCLLTFLNPETMLPFITLVSATWSLGVDSHIKLLTVCPNC
jgi:hypothetical protein